jgi:polar amino acid transport system substrate-binding protein
MKRLIKSVQMNINVIAVAVLIICSCSRNGNGGGANTFTSLADFSGKKIASESGSVFAQFIDRIIPNVDHRLYYAFDDIVAALRTGKVDAVALDMPVALYFVAHNDEFAVFPYVISVDNYGFAVPKGSRLFVAGNDALRKLQENGAIDEAEKRWFAAGDDKEKTIPEFDYRDDFDGSAGTIRFGCENTLSPMSYTSSSGKPMGFDIEILQRLAYELNMKVEVVAMPFGDLLPALLSGHLDMAGGSMTITGERQESVDFIGPYFEGGTALVVKKRNMPER